MVTVLRSISFLLLGCALAGFAPGQQPALIRNGGGITIKTASFVEARARIVEAAEKANGRVETAQSMKHATGRESGSLRLEVPTENARELIDAIRAQGILVGESANRLNLDERKEVLQGRIERLRVHQGRLRGLLGSGRNLRGSDALFLQERLFRSELDEEAMLQAVRNLERLAGTTSISLTMFEPATEVRLHNNTFLGRANQAWEDGKADLGGAVGSLLTGLARFAITAPVWLPIVFVAWLGLRKMIRSLSSETGPPPTPSAS
jgi:hypothetical protein